MKKFVLLIIMLVAMQGMHANNVHVVTFNFNKGQFIFNISPSSLINISAKDYLVYYDENSNTPGLPWIPYNIMIEKSETISGFEISTDKGIISRNLIVAPNPEVHPTNLIANQVLNVSPNYMDNIYPKENVRFIESTDFEKYTNIRVLVCPFIYNATDTTLSFINSIDLSINTQNKVSPIQTNTNEVQNNMIDIAGNNIDMRNSSTYTRSFTFDGVINRMPLYMVITSSDLAHYYESLIIWKKTKGLKAEIHTTDEIKSLYPEDDIQLSIKKYLESRMKDDLEYVLLGGDDTVVPSRECHIHANGKDDFTPTDLYYACLRGDLSWDSNNNGIYGELTDKLILDPSIFVSRLPVRTPQDVTTYCNRVIQYEKNPMINGWENSMLMVGCKLIKKLENSRSDADQKGQKLYESVIKPYWQGNINRFYDTSTDFEGGANYELNSTNLLNLLNKGYTFVDVITHGSTTAWGMEKGLFDVTYSENMTSPKYTIITTNACLTNAFDSFWKEGNEEIPDPCLSESFIRNEKSGVLAYLGSSRYGWASRDEDLGPSLKYEASFYQNLFLSKNKNFARITSAAKQALLGFSKDNNPYRWIQFALNPIGDPEMPIFTTTPKVMKNIRCSYDVSSGNLTVGSILDSCRISIMSAEDNGKTIHKSRSNVNILKIGNVRTKVIICVTKQGYIPQIREFEPPHKTNRIISCTSDISGAVVVQTQIADNAKNARLVLSSKNGVNLNTVDIKGEYSTLSSKGKLNSNKDIHIITLFVNGHKVDSKTISK